jgi:hypothetical protein
MIRKAGWDLKRLKPKSDHATSLNTFYQNNDVNILFDIGANIGQYSLESRLN